MRVRVGNKTYTTKATAPRPRLFFKKDNIVEYLELTQDKNLTSPGNKFYVMINNIKHYVKEIFVNTGEVFIGTVNLYIPENACIDWTNVIKPREKYGFINSLKVKNIYNYYNRPPRRIIFDFIIYNAKNLSKSVQKSVVLEGASIPVEPNGTIESVTELTSEDLRVLGGSETEILIQYRGYFAAPPLLGPKLDINIYVITS